MVTEKSWKEFRESGVFWFMNTILHTFGWSIILDVNEFGGVERAYPARVKFRGFSEEVNSEGYAKVTEYLKDNVGELLEDTKQ